MDRDPAHGTGARPPDRADRAGHRRRRRERAQRRLPLGLLVRHRRDRRALRRRGRAPLRPGPGRRDRCDRLVRGGQRHRLLVPQGRDDGCPLRRMAGELRRRSRRVPAARHRRSGGAAQRRADARARRLPEVPGRVVLRGWRGLSAGATGARAPPGGARAGRASVRTHAHDRPRPVAAGGGAHRARSHQGEQGGVDHGRVGRRRRAVPSELRRDRGLRRGDRADPTAARGDRLDLARRDRRRARVALLPAPDRRRPDRDRRWGGLGGLRRPRQRSRGHGHASRRGGAGAWSAVDVPAAGGRPVHARLGRSDRSDADVRALLPNVGSRERARRSRVQRARARPDLHRRAHPRLDGARDHRRVDDAGGQPPGDRQGAAGAVSVPARACRGVRARARRCATGRGPVPRRACTTWWATYRSAIASGWCAAARPLSSGRRRAGPRACAAGRRPRRWSR